MKIGVIRVGGLGDSIVFSPFLRELRKLYPNGEITLFVQHNSSGEYFSRIKHVDKLEYIDKDSSLLTKIGWIFKYFKRYDLVIDTINGTKISNIIANLFGRKTIGFKKHGKYSITIPNKQYNENDFIPLQDLTILKTLKELDINGIDLSLEFPLKESDEDNAKTKNLGNKYCVFHTGGSSQRFGYFSKNLSLEQIETIIDFIIQAGYYCVIIGSKNDEEIKSIKDRPNLTKITDLSIRELGYLIKGAELYIGGNSGPMWISMALNKKSIVISSATSESWQPLKRFFPNVNNIISDYKGCSKCGLYKCKYNKNPKEQGLCIKNLDMNIIKDLISNK